MTFLYQKDKLGEAGTSAPALTRATAASGAVAAVIPAAVAMAAPAAIELVAKFERLLDEYCARRSAWPAISEGVRRNGRAIRRWVNGDDAKDRERFFSEACACLDVNEAHDRMHAVGEEIKPLARAIIALPTTSRKCCGRLVAFWEVVPLCADDTDYHFGDENPFQLLFSAVAEFCGLTQKSPPRATRSELPDLFSPCNDDDDEGEEA